MLHSSRIRIRRTRFRSLLGVVAVSSILGSLLGVATAALEAVGPTAPVADAAPVAGGLGYTALGTPCRAVDTRVTGVPDGDLVANETRNFQIRGTTSLAGQGGNASGCGVPSTAQAVEVSITAVSPSGTGFVRAYAAGGTVPTATFINYTNGRGITNTGTVPLNTAQIQDLGITNFGGTIHVIVDVQGYFEASTGTSYVPLATPCRVVDTRNAGGTLAGGTSRAFQVAGSGSNFAAQGGTAGGCSVPDGVFGVEVSLTVASPVGTGFVRVAPNDGTVPNATFINYNDATGITNTGTVTPSNTQDLDVLVQNFGGTIHVIVDVQGYFTNSGDGTRYQTVTPCRTVDTRNTGGPFTPDLTRTFQTAGVRGEFVRQGGGNPTGCGVPQRATAVEASITAVSPTGSGFTRPAPAGTVPAATFLNYTAVGGITNTGTVPLAGGGLQDLAVKNFGGTANYIVDVLGYFEPPASDPTVSEQVVGGNDHSCELRSTGDVWCTGANSRGQAGNGGFTERRTPRRAVGIHDAVQLAAGSNHTCALRIGGTISCWGFNNIGQLGGFPGADSPVPVAVTGLSDVVRITSGGDNTCALRSVGTVSCWGRNIDGQLGRGTTGGLGQPGDVTGLSDAVDVATSGDHACALRRDGSAECWGDNASGQVGDGGTVDTSVPVPVVGLIDGASIDVGSSSSCAVLADGTSACWGDGGTGRLGNGSLVNATTPTAVLNLTGITSIAAGENHTCALLDTGAASCWGQNGTGALGNGTLTLATSPGASVSGLVGATALLGSLDFSCAVVASGTTSCWGRNDGGALGDGTVQNRPVPVAVSGHDGVVAVDAASHGCAVLASGGVECWGLNSSGQLGDGSTTTRTTPVAVTGISTATMVSTGAAHTCAVLSDRTVRCWGSNTSGQLGNTGAGVGTPSPVEVTGLTEVVEVAAGSTHTCAVRTDGTVRCWGSGTAGELGNGSTTDSTTPVTVSGLGDASHVSAGSEFSCATTLGGVAECWGVDDQGQLGDGATGSGRSTPAPVDTTNGITEIASGTLHTCATEYGGAPVCWGLNNVGQLGDGTNINRSSPTAVQGSLVAIGTAGGVDHSCFLLSDATVRCVGSGTGGALGNNATANSSSPVVAGPLDPATTVAAGDAVSCASTAADSVASGSAYCWGIAATGRLGNGSSTNSPVPTGVTGLS